MNTDPNPKRILCYGDSNTWGYIPGVAKRHDPNVRWTGILQQKLGRNYEIIEEGLNGRTTIIDDDVKVGRNGKTYLRPCLQTHDPLDLVILFLGTNDMKEKYKRTPEQIAIGIEELVEIIKTTEYHHSTKVPKVILLSPPLINENVPGVKDKYNGAGEKSKKLGDIYNQIAKKHVIHFIDLAKEVSPSEIDGYHLEPEAHKKIATLLYKKLISIFQI